MKNILKKRFALATVVTTLIILVISVLLAGVVADLAINVTSNRAQQEDLTLTMQHLWYDGTNHASQATLAIINTGGRDVVIQKIAIRGQTVIWGNVFYYSGKFALTGDLPYIPSVSDGSPTTVSDGQGSFEVLHAATNDLTLQSGYSMIVYVGTPDSIAINDIGTTVSINVFTSQAMYYKEANVQAPGGSGSGGGDQSLSASNMHAWYDSSGSVSQVAMVLKNNGADIATIDSVMVNSASSDNMFSCEGAFTLSSNLAYISNLQDGTTIGLYMLSSVGGQLPAIEPGQSMIVYIQNPGGITASDIGQTVGIEISLQGQGAVIENVLVQATT